MHDDEMSLAEAIGQAVGTSEGRVHTIAISLFMTIANQLVTKNICDWNEIADGMESQAEAQKDNPHSGDYVYESLMRFAGQIRAGSGPHLTLVK